MQLPYSLHNRSSYKNDSTAILYFTKVHISENCPSCEKYENETAVFVQSAMCQDKSFLTFLQSID